MGVALVADAAVAGRTVDRTRGGLRFVLGGALMLLIAYLIFRTVSPYTFASSNWFDVSLDAGFRDALRDEVRRVNGDFLYPPSYQWLLSTPVWSPLEYLVRWQLGIPLGIAALAGVALLLERVSRPLLQLVRRRGGGIAPSAFAGPATRWLMLLAYVIVVFFWIAPRFAHIAGPLPGSDHPVPRRRSLVRPSPALRGSAARVRRRRRRRRRGDRAVRGRVRARLRAGEHAHDRIGMDGPARERGFADRERALGRLVAGRRRAQRFTLLELPVFEPDDGKKLGRLHDALSESDYYFVSSPRAWKTIGRLPDRFPLMTGSTRSSSPAISGSRRRGVHAPSRSSFGVGLHDLSAEEAFWVYDHPPVSIYRRVGPLTRERFRAVLCPTANTACT